MSRSLLLRRARVQADAAPMDVLIVDGLVQEVAAEDTLECHRIVDAGGGLLLPSLVNAHDHLDLATAPAVGHPPYANAEEWMLEVVADPDSVAAMSLALVDRLWLGALRNVLAGVTVVAHHAPWHRLMGREEFPVRVQERYDFAHSPTANPALRRTYRTTDRRIPWFVHAAEGTDPRSAAEVDVLAAANVLRQNTVIVHGVGLRPEDPAAIAAAAACVVWCPEANRRLYGASAPVDALRNAGVRIGLGSDSAASGVRDVLSNLAAARREGVYDDAALMQLATTGSADVIRMPLGGVEPGSIADLIVVEDAAALLSGRRDVVQLVLKDGEPSYGVESMLAGAAIPALPIRVDGAWRGLRRDLARRLRDGLRATTRRPPAWLEGLEA